MLLRKDVRWRTGVDPWFSPIQTSLIVFFYDFSIGQKRKQSGVKNTHWRVFCLSEVFFPVLHLSEVVGSHG